VSVEIGANDLAMVREFEETVSSYSHLTMKKITTDD